MLKKIVRSDRVTQILRNNPGALSFAMPIIRKLRRERTNTGGTDEAAYCYSVFLRHLKAGAIDPPRTVMEFGPGDSIGVGLCWLIAGADTYYAMDAHPYAAVDSSLNVFEDLVDLFRRQAPGCDSTEIFPQVEDLSFPDNLTSVDLSPSRLDDIRNAIRVMHDGAAGRVTIAYRAPWSVTSEVPAASVDLACSQAVLEHVMDLPGTYQAMAKWLRPGGYLSHQIDFRSHDSAFDWNGHWMYTKRQWARANSSQPYLAINRAPCSEHLKLIAESGFDIVTVMKAEMSGGIEPSHVARDFAGLAEGDLTCSGLYVCARRI